MVNLASIPPLVPLFAPYCGGVDRERELGSAIRTLAEGQLQGIRALKDGGGHSFKLSWSGELAPLATLAWTRPTPGWRTASGPGCSREARPSPHL